MRYTFKLTKKYIFIATIVIIVTVAVIVLLTLGLTKDQQTDSVGHGAVTAVARDCAKIGTDILRINGSAIDAAIAALFCDGALTMQSMGLGGGFMATLYTKSTGLAVTLNARETAPAAAYAEMFENVTLVTGPLSVGVPGELKGYAALHERYGNLPWRELIEPTINLCRNGFPMSSILASSVLRNEQLIRTNLEFRKIFLNPDTDELYKAGNIIRRPKLAETLELIATVGADTLYTLNGRMAIDLISELNGMGGIMTLEDLVNYQVTWQEPVSAKIFNNQTLYSLPIPGSGSVLIFIMNILKDFLPTEKSVVYYQRLIESFKFAYAQRTKLADPKFVPDAVAVANNLTDPLYAYEHRLRIHDNETSQNYTYYGAEYANEEDHGTAHISVLAPNGDAVSITSTVNTLFGSKILLKSTGIILNDEMDDFSVPGKENAYGLKPSPANYIQPGKTPLSSMCPSIIVDQNGDVQMIIGAAGGSKITTTVANIISSHILLNESLVEAVAEHRLHHQLAPMYINYESGFNEHIRNGLKQLGHELVELFENGFSAATAISRWGGKLVAVSDGRRNGSVSVF